MYCKKIIILKNANDKNNFLNAILTLEQISARVVGKLKFFEKLDFANCVLQIYADDKILFESKILLKNSCEFLFDFLGDMCAKKLVACVFDSAKNLIFIGGNCNAKLVYEQKIAKKTQKNTQKTQKNVIFEQKNDNFEKSKNFEEKVETKKIEKVDNENFDFGLKPQKEFLGETPKILEEKSGFEKDFLLDKNNKIFENESQKDQEQNGEQNFFGMIEDDFENLFKMYPRENKLCSLIKNSDFVKIDLDETKFYAIGKINEGQNLKYICYAIPSKGKQNPPDEIAPFCQWLPLDFDNEFGDGYFVMYQDAKTGENLSFEL